MIDLVPDLSSSMVLYRERQGRMPDLSADPGSGEQSKLGASAPVSGRRSSCHPSAYDGIIERS